MTKIVVSTHRILKPSFEVEQGQVFFISNPFYISGTNPSKSTALLLLVTEQNTLVVLNGPNAGEVFELDDGFSSQLIEANLVPELILTF